VNIAVIGASADPNKIGFSLLKNLIDGSFPGKIYPINLKEESILGLKCYPNIGATGKKIDLAIIAVPADTVPEIIAECVDNQTSFAIIISSGFAESGTEGNKKQEEILSLAKGSPLRILGPNCLGIISPGNRLNASFATNMPERKNIGVISQSGATCTAILDWANKRGIGFSHFVSLGNKADLSEDDFLEYFINDDETEVVIGYLEAISDGPKFIELSRALTRKKPFILLKAGKSQAGLAAAKSHTAALAGDDQVLDQALREAGVIRADNLEDLFEWTNLFASLKTKDDSVLVITNAGGPGVMAVDQINAENALKLFSLPPKLVLDLKRELPNRLNIGNPLDLQGDADSKLFSLVFEKTKKLNSTKLVILTPQSRTDIDKIAHLAVKEKDQRTIVVLIGGEKFEQASAIFGKNDIPVFLYPERAIRGLEKLVFYHNYRKGEKPHEKPVQGLRKAADRALTDKDNLTDNDIAKLLAAYRIPIADSRFTTNANEAVEAAEKIGYPVVLKVASADIIHKTEVGAVKVGIENEEVLRSSYQEILRNARKNKPKAKISGVTVYRMVRSSVELAIGAKRDPVFGPFVLFGLGGIYIEVFRDFQIRLAPVGKETAKEMIKEIKGYNLFNGYRNGEKHDLEKLAEAISGLSQLMIDYPQISEVDVNPIRFVTGGKNILGLDAKIILDEEKS
jgi:acetyltransferase